MSDSDVDYDSKAQFIEAVRDHGAVIERIEYFTEGEGSSTSYHARTEDGEIEDITKSDVEDAWEDAQDEEPADEDTSAESEPKEIHIGTFYYSKSNWDDDHLQELIEILAEADWEITGEVSSGGYRISVVR